MKISQLAQSSGESIPTIKFYIRRGLLPPGNPSAKNQASYDRDHLERLSLIRTLRDDLHLTVEEMLLAVAALPVRLTEFGSVMSPGQRPDADALGGPELKTAREELSATLRDLGWLIDQNDPTFQQAVSCILTIGRLLPGSEPRHYLGRLASSMYNLALCEVEEDALPSEAARTLSAAAFRHYVLSTCAYEPLLIALRRMARAERVAQLQTMEAPRLGSGRADGSGPTKNEPSEQTNPTPRS